MTMIAAIDTKSTVGDGIASANAGWTFGGEIPKFFESHVSKSVPQYAEGHDITLALSDYFVKEDSVCYELGSSTGALTRKLSQRHPASVKWIGIDVEKNMVEQAQNYLVDLPTIKNIEYLVDDAVHFPYQKSDLIVAYYTVQFIPPRVRQELFNRIYQTLHWGGAFIMFEKVRAPDARFQDICSSLYVDYKLSKGYAGGEIVAKAKSLKGVLEPFSTDGNIDALKRAGFTDLMSIFKYVCFEGFLCIK